MANQNIQKVEILCKTTRKTWCKSSVKLCVQKSQSQPKRAKLTFFTKFSHFFHILSHQQITPNIKQFYPLFHRDYYYNYYIYNIIERIKL